MVPEHLTSIHFFDFHRNVRSLQYTLSSSLSIGPYSPCHVELPTPSLFKGVVSLDAQHILTTFESFEAFRKNKAAETKQFTPPKDSYTLETSGIMLTVCRSWQPFLALIDTLIEECGVRGITQTSQTFRDDIKRLLPEELLKAWDLDTIWNAFSVHRKGYGDIEPLMIDPAVTEILINASDSVFFEKNGRFCRMDYSLSSLRLERLMTKLVQKSGRSVNTKNPIVDLQLETGERVNIILPPVSKKGPVISIRKFRKQLLSLDSIASLNTVSSNQKVFLKRIVQDKKNILVSGGTGSGKTTLLNILLSECDTSDRIIIVEDSSELCPNHPHWLNLETRPTNQDKDAQISMATLIKNTLRMRPTRVICGECRGPEAFQMLLAMNSGHPGSMTTIHANSPREALYRLEIFLLMSGFDVPHRAVRQFIASAIDIIIQMEPVSEGQRRVSQIALLDTQTHGLDASYTLSTVDS